MSTKRTKIIAIMGSLFFLVSVCACTIFSYSIWLKKSSFNERSEERAEAKNRLESLEALTHTLEETKNEREFMYSRILTDDSVIDLLALVETFGEEQGVKLTTNSLTVGPTNKNFEPLIINVTVEGSYSRVMHVLKLFEHLPYQATVHSVVLNRKDESLWTSTYEVRVTKIKKI